MSARRAVAERLEAFTLRASECWVFTGKRNVKGYGTIGNGKGGTVLAHRLAWELKVGPIPPGMYVLHRCDNPACIRADPDPTKSHLFVGTQSDNIRDAAAKGRTWPQKYGVPAGDANWNTVVPDDTVIEMRRAYAAGEGTQAAIGARHGVNAKLAGELISGRKRKHIAIRPEEKP